MDSSWCRESRVYTRGARKADKLTPGGNESGGFGANKRKGDVGNVSCMNPSMLRQCGKLGAISCFV